MNTTPTLLQMEVTLARYFDSRANTIVPNVSFGLGVHECDLLIVRSSGYCIEVEIKRSRADLKKDAEKSHGHKSKKIKELYFALPECLSHCTDLVPEHAGIILIKNNNVGHRMAQTIRKPVPNKEARKLTPAEIIKLGKLGCMRIWSLKQSLLGMINDRKL